MGVEPYVLRYWESEFPQIRPGRADSKQRTYQKKDLEIIGEIKRLLYEEKLTIEGAKKRLKEKIYFADPTDPSRFINEIKRELQEILRIFNK
jgi:DNA-binding transcriptional MerR regulator